ncbi:hypothetical protein [Alkalihalobacillus sp. AL-G]|uniref:hypothetical protein n=1 Tax=Alkalihalobacillus sp. AL-G TaxID=2926399 RepID=UPI00272C304D|nr:hypothetical protein [Alkalihalobacillus sp. AL-G]WLD94203.1 hypothetical protein MOJ78_04735 [Alkalihalobacillus sp. AL-G]
MTKRKKVQNKVQHHNQTPTESLPDYEIADEIAKGPVRFDDKDIPKRNKQNL